MSINKRQRAAVLCFAFAALGIGLRAHADEYESRRVAPLPKYLEECAACHIAYPPGLLPAASWQSLMSKLQYHFGSDASLDPATSRELTAWLKLHSGTSKRVRRDSTPPPEDRITRAGWFKREHDEVSSATWRLASVKSASNCGACHPQAAQGDFNEHSIRIPR